jgi:hypothetical protein
VRSTKFRFPVTTLAGSSLKNISSLQGIHDVEERYRSKFILSRVAVAYTTTFQTVFPNLLLTLSWWLKPLHRSGIIYRESFTSYNSPMARSLSWNDRESCFQYRRLQVYREKPVPPDKDIPRHLNDIYAKFGLGDFSKVSSRFNQYLDQNVAPERIPNPPAQETIGLVDRYASGIMQKLGYIGTTTVISALPKPDKLFQFVSGEKPQKVL